MTNCEIFPIKIEDYITYHKFEDSKEIYTNGAELITVYDIEKALKYYDYENKIEQLEKALDKAIEMITKGGEITMYPERYEWTYELWKEYLLKESEER